jgi:hypothetical protein
MLGTMMKYLQGSSPIPGPMSQSFSQCLPENQDGYNIALLRSSFNVPHTLYASLAPLSVAPSLRTKSPRSKMSNASLSPCDSARGSRYIGPDMLSLRTIFRVTRVTVRSMDLFLEDTAPPDGDELPRATGERTLESSTFVTLLSEIVPVSR